MQATSATWKALAARLDSPAFIPGDQALSVYSGDAKIYETGSGQHIQLYSKGQKIYDSDLPQVVEVYSGDTRIYASGEMPEYGESVTLEARVTIGGAVYDDEITAPIIQRALSQNGIGVGNAVSAACFVRIRTGDDIPKAAAVLVEMRLTDGTTTSEWRPAGTYYISKRERDPVSGYVALECYDALLKGNAVWTPSAGDWPRTMASVVSELAALLDVTLDSRTLVPSAMMDAPLAGATIRDVLGTVAQAAGGNWIMSPDNKLRLVAVGTAYDALRVSGVVGWMDVGETGTITGVRCNAEKPATLIGDDSGLVVDVTITEDQAAGMAGSVIGQAYQPFQLAGAIYDPAVELGDTVRGGAGGEVASVLYAETATLAPAFTGTLAAPQGGELYDEYPYIGSVDKTLAQAEAYTDAEVDKLDESLNQQAIFNRLTNNGEAQGLFVLNGQLYVNATYLRGGTIDGGLVNVKLLNIVDEHGNVIASFNDVIQIGRSGEARAQFDFNSFEMYDKDDDGFLTVGDMRDSEGLATVQETFSYIGSSIIYTFVAKYAVTEVVSVYFNGAQQYPTITISGRLINLDFGSTLYFNPTFVITYRTTAAIYHYDFGARKAGTETGYMSIVEGGENEASGDYSHAEGRNTTSSGDYSHAEGDGSVAVIGRAAHAEGGGGTIARGDYSHAEGQFTIAAGEAQHVSGRFNVIDPSGLTIEQLYDPSIAWQSLYAEIVGNGANENSRSNARTLDWNGNEWIAGVLTQASDARIKDETGEVPDLSGIRARRFRWKDDRRDKREHIGYFAQDVETVAPWLVHEDAMGYKALDYIALLCAKVEMLERRVKELETNDRH